VTGAERRRIPDATVERLPIYLRCLQDLVAARAATVSSDRLAELAGVNAAKVRKDLSYLGSYGTRGVGYDVGFLVFNVRRELGLSEEAPVVIVGIGNLGHALAGYGGFGARGFPVAALLDADPARVGEDVGGVVVRHVDELPDVVARLGVVVGVVTTPADQAQEVVDRLVAAGVGSILNFAPTTVTAPAGVAVRQVDLALELQILSFYRQQAIGGAVPDGGGAAPRPQVLA
jgi:redox-sensing transcriptional repressor